MAALLAAVLPLLLLLSPCRAGQVVVDDISAQWQYTGPWGQIDAAHPCPQCQSQPAPQDARDGTWHDCSGACSATLSFAGAALYVYAICPGPLAGGGAYTSTFGFALDNATQPEYAAPPCTAYEYNSLVFAVDGLAPGPHTFVIENLNGAKSDLLLDYALVDDGSGSGVAGAGSSVSVAGAAAAAAQPPPKDHLSRAQMAAVVLPILLVVAALGGIAVWHLRWRRRRIPLESIINPQVFDPEPHSADVRVTSWRLSGTTGTTSYAPPSSTRDSELEAALHIIASRAVRAPALMLSEKRGGAQMLATNWSPREPQPPSYAESR